MEKAMIKVGKSLSQLSEMMSADNLEEHQKHLISDSCQEIETVMNALHRITDKDLSEQPVGIRPKLELTEIFSEYSKMLEAQGDFLRNKEAGLNQPDHIQKIYFDDNLYLIMLEKLLYKMTQQKELKDFFYSCKKLQYDLLLDLEGRPESQLIN